MAQSRFWNWKDDDSTFRLNQWNLFAIPFGLYRGFYKKSNLTDFKLTLVHIGDNSYKNVDNSLNFTNELGVWKTRQGVTIIEDTEIVLEIEDPDNHDRIDLIVGEHQYTQTIGGNSAIYKVIKGTPNDNPIEPALQNEQTQVILGKVYIPKTASNLDDCEYTRVTEMFNNDKLPRLYTTNEFTDVNYLKKIDNSIVSATYQNPVLKLQDFGQIVFLQDYSTTPIEIGMVDYSIDKWSKTEADNESTITIISTVDVVIKDIGFISIPNGVNNVMIPAGIPFKLAKHTANNHTQWFYRGSYADLLNTSNKYSYLQVWNKGGVATINGDNEIELPAEFSILGGNFIELDNSGNNDVDALQSLADYTKYPTMFKKNSNISDEAGGVIYLKLKQDTRFNNLGGATNQNAKEIKILSGGDMTYPAGTVLMLLEDNDYWLLLDAFNAELKTTVENFSLDFNKTIVKKTTVITQTSEIAYQDFGNGDYGWDINRNIGNQVLFYHVGNIGGEFRFMPENLPIGTKISIRFAHSVISFNFDSNNNIGAAPSGWLPISKLRDSHINNAFQFTPQKDTTYTLLRLIDRWVLYEEESRLPEWVAGEEDLPHLYLAGKVDIHGARIGYYGKNRVYDNNSHSYFPFISEKLSTGHYKVTHNLGTNKYVVVSASSDTGNKKASIYDANSTYFKVGTSDDATYNDSAFMFMVIRIK